MFCFIVFSNGSLIFASFFFGLFVYFFHVCTHLRHYQGHVPVFRQAGSTSHLSQQQLL